MLGPPRGPVLAHLLARRTLIWAALLALLAAWLCVTPLFDVLGFELAFALTVPTSLAAADLGAAHVRRAREAGALRCPGRTLAQALVVALALLALPLFLSILNATRVRQCDWGFGFLCFAVLPVPSAIFGSVAGVAPSLALPARPRTAALISWLIVLGSIVWGVLRFYSGPAIFGYDAFAGYFPGTLYDEELRFSAAFWWSRLYQAAWAAAAVLFLVAAWDGAARRPRAALLRTRPVALAAAIFALAGGVGLGAASGRLGFAVSASDVARALGGRRETPNFVIHYPRALEPVMDAVAREHEFRLAQVLARLGVDRLPAKIHSFYFLDEEQKWRWMGARQTYIAKPWRHEIYIQHEDFPHPTLRHEIAHVVAGVFGDPLFRVSVKWLGWPPASFNVGLIEGIAVAADWPAGAGRLTPHQAVRAMKELELLPPVARLLQPGFFAFSPAQSYTTAGSFVYFLLAEHGPAKLHEIYRRGGAPGDFPAVYGVPLAELEAAWHAEIARAPLEPEDLEIARERFRRRAIFARPCPHAVADRLDEAARALARGRPAAAVAALRRVCRDDPGEPRHRMALARALAAAGEDDEALGTWRALFDDDGTRVAAPLRARALWSAADFLARKGRLADALVLVDRALALGVDEDSRRNLIVRRQAFAGAADDPGARALRDYLLPPEDAAAAEPELPPAGAPGVPADDPHLARARALPAALPGLGHYLFGRALVQRGRWAEAAPVLLAAEPAGLAEPLVRRENMRLLARAAFLAGDLVGARRAAGELSRDRLLQVRLEGDDWLERIHHAETGALPPAAPP